MRARVRRRLASRYRVLSSIKAKLLVAVGAVIVLASAAYFFPLVPALEHVSAWLGGLGVIEAALFAVLIAVSTLCLLPPSPSIIPSSAVCLFSFVFLPSPFALILC